MLLKRIFLYLSLLGFSLTVAQSCNTGKKGCGCGTNLNEAWHRPKQFR